MKDIEKFFVDKSRFNQGPWMKEPDKVQFYDPTTKATCLIVRNHMGALCGYVGVPEGHPAFEKDYNEVDYYAHGGLTFASFCVEDEKENGICHVPFPGEPDRVWWLGFDCGHAGDLIPEMEAYYRQAGISSTMMETYKDIAYVRQECLDLAKQLFNQ